MLYLTDMDYGNFEDAVYVLAEDLKYTPEGSSVDSFQLGLATIIAGAINRNRDSLRAEYPLEPTTGFIDVLHQKLGTLSVQKDEAVKFGLSTLEIALREDNDHRRRIGQWLAPLIPKMERTQVKPIKVIKSLLNHPELRYTSDDFELAEEVLHPPVHTLLQPEVKKSSSDQLEDYELSMVAEGLLRMLASAARKQQHLTKVEMYSQPDFTRVLRVVGDVPTRPTFYTAWEVLVAFFEDYDPTYQPFSYEGEGWNRRYILNDPDLVEIIWGMEQETGADASLDNEETTDHIQQFEGRIIRITKDKLVLDSKKHIQLDDDAQHAAANKLLAREAQFISTGRLYQEVAEELRLPRAEVEQTIRSLLRSLGPNYLERRFSSKKNKALVRIRPNARGVIPNL